MIGLERGFSKVGKILIKSTVSAFKPVQQSFNFTVSTALTSVRCNSNRASICRINRLQYLRHYPCAVVNPDGSTYTIRYTEPRKIIKLPVDINSLTELERKKHLEKRKPRTKVSLEEEFDDIQFDASKYLKLVKKNL